MIGVSVGRVGSVGLASSRGGGVPAGYRALTNKTGSLRLTNKDGSIVLLGKAA